MRVLFVAALALLVSACASERLQLNPPAGVDFSGKWTLDDADSDDPQHLLSPQTSHRTPNPNGDPAPQGQSRGRRGGGPGGPGAPGAAPGGGGMFGPAPPGPAALGAPLNFPGKQLELKQVAGVVSFSSDGRNRVCQPGTEHKRRPKADYRDRDPTPAQRENVPTVCGWEAATMVVLAGEPDDERPLFEEQYTLSPDRQRLIETVVFKGGRSGGFTLSRVWNRETPAQVQ